MLINASWNINSVRRRLGQLERLAEISGADVLCLQETKAAAAAAFPAAEIAAMGFVHQAVSGFGGYNGVAILSRRPVGEIARYSHCGRNDALHISATIDGVSIHSLYVPAGGEIPDVARNPKFAHKLKFIDTVADHFAGHHGYRDAIVVAGDFNVAPRPADVWDHLKLSRIVTHTPIEIAAWND